MASLLHCYITKPLDGIHTLFTEHTKTANCWFFVLFIFHSLDVSYILEALPDCQCPT